MDEIKKLLRTFGKLCLIPEKELEEALRVILKDIPGVRVAALNSARRQEFSREIITCIFMAKDENTVSLTIRDVKGNSSAEICFYNFPDNVPRSESQYKHSEPTKSLNDHLNAINYFLINGKTDGNYKCELITKDPMGEFGDKNLHYDVMFSVGLQ
ncbi:MAG: hypothetical protein WC564_05430 [Patescibacteria group bacterium]